MARPFERLKGLNIASLIEEAVNTLNPENGLTQEEMVEYVCCKLGFEQDRVQDKVNQILSLGTQTGALVTDGMSFTLNDNNKLRRLALEAAKKRRAVKRRRKISKKRNIQRRR